MSGGRAALPAPVLEVIDGLTYAHLATLMPDGGPHTVPVWIGREGDLLAVQTSPRSRKARNLERDPRVAVSATAADNPFVMVQIRGKVAARLEGDAAWDIIDRISRKYIGQPYPLRSDRCVFLIDPEHATATRFA